MAAPYFEDILSQCWFTKISAVCEHYKDAEQLKLSVTKDWEKCRYFTEDHYLIIAVHGLLYTGDLAIRHGQSSDWNTVNQRCFDAITEYDDVFLHGRQIDHDRLFNTLVDVCWMLASVQHRKKRGIAGQELSLLRDPNTILRSTKDYLESVRISAERSYTEALYYDDALAAVTEHPFFPTRYDFQYPQAKQYALQVRDDQKLRDGKEDYLTSCRLNLALYYGLTATSALVRDIRRGLC